MALTERRGGTLHVEAVSLADIAEQFGTPCYVYSRKALTEAYNAYRDALSGHSALICYAVKANSNLAVLNLFARLGAGFDIVSGGELARVLAAGGEEFPARRERRCAVGEVATTAAPSNVHWLLKNKRMGR